MPCALTFAYPMFLILLGGSLVVGASLFAVASYSEGTLLAVRTTALVIGGLFLVAALASVAGLRRGALGEISAAAITLCAGLALLGLASFGWSKAPASALHEAVIETTPAPLAATKMLPAEIPYAARNPERVKRVAARPLAVASAAAPCAALEGLESVQCSRCNERSGLAWIACQERVRLEYCESEQGNELICPSPIPQSAPG